LPQREWLSEADFALLADSVQSRRTQHRFLLTAWVFLPDHWHAIIMPPYPSTISRVMESIKVSSTRLINKLRADRGVLWQGRFFDRALRTVKEYHEKVEYIHLNPVKRGLVHRSISPLYFTTAGNLSTISPEGAKENSPGRKPWENVRPLSPEPRRGDRIWANLAASFAPTGAPGEKNRKTFPFSQGLRPGLLSAALRAKENNIMNQSNDVLAAS